MPISANHLKFLLSGGSENTDSASSLGGAPSGYQVTGGLDAVFDNVSPDQAQEGLTDYRCLFFINEDSNVNGLVDPVIWFTMTPSTSAFSLGIDPKGKNAEAQLIEADGQPTGVTFSTPTSFLSSVSLPDDPYEEGDYVAIWVRRVVPAGSSATVESAALKVRGSTL